MNGMNREEMKREFELQLKHARYNRTSPPNPNPNAAEQFAALPKARPRLVNKGQPAGT